MKAPDLNLSVQCTPNKDLSHRVG